MSSISLVPGTTLELGSIARVTWGNTSITKASYVSKGFIAFSASGPDGFLPTAEWKGPGVILSAIGARCGRAFYADGSWTAIKNTIVIQSDESSLSNKYLFYWLNEPTRWKIAGSGQPFITLKSARSTLIPLATLPRQREIVVILETQFSRLDAGIAALKRAQANLKRYRASVLQAACEGRLVPTEHALAQAEGRDYETGEQLLQRILTERRQSWSGKGKHKEPERKPSVETAETLAPLPQGWIWTVYEAIAEIKGGVTKDQKKIFSGASRSVPYLRVANVQRGRLDLEEIKLIQCSEQTIEELKLQRGDILLNEGGDRDKLGRGWIWQGEIEECIHQNHVFRARVNRGCIIPQLYSWYGNTFGQKFFFDEGKQTTNLASVSMSKVRSLPIPLPPFAEQVRIVAEVERRLSVVDQLEKTITANLSRATRLRQAILKEAFTFSFQPNEDAI